MTAVWLALLMLLWNPMMALAVDRTAASCSRDDVNTALGTAQAGDRVLIPAGTCTWTSPISWTAPANTQVVGAGTTAVGGGDVTNITDGYTTNSPLWNITTPSTGTFRFTGLTIRAGTLKDAGILSFTGSNAQTRLDHLHIDLTTGTSGQVAIKMHGAIYGVMDHSLCSDAGGIRECINLYLDNANGTNWGDGTWIQPTNFGGSDFFFLEDNIFDQGGYLNDCSQGAKVVVRYNTINNAKAQTHPTGSGGRFRGCRASEVYNNTYNGSTACDGGGGFNNCAGHMFWLSSGTLLMWGNTAPVVNAQAQSGYSFVVDLHSMRRDNSTYGQTATPNGWGYCGTSFNGTGSNWDQNSNASTGYACLDQPGRGQGQALTNQDFPNVVNAVTGTIAWPQQALEPVYEWLNTFTPVPNNPSGRYNNGSTSVLTQNQDYYAYTTSFTGASGVGAGLLSARPSTCTPKVAYWATDITTLYQCTAPNTWVLYYTPYTYPHPLQGGAPPPAAATVLRVIR